MTDPQLQQAAWLARSSGRGELSPFTSEVLRELAASLGSHAVKAGTLLMRQGEPVRSIGVIRDGRVELARRDGSRRVVLQVLHPGDVFGDIPLLCGTSPPFAARALTDVRLISIDAEDLDRVLHTRPTLARRMLFSVASRLQRMQRRLLELTRSDLRSQVCALLLDETEGEPGAVPLAQSTIAELLGATRPR